MGRQNKHTVSALFEVIAKLPSDAKVQPVPVLVIILAADLGPLDNNFGDHPDIHGGYTEPEKPFLPLVAHPQQRDGKGCLCQCLSD